MARSWIAGRRLSLRTGTPPEEEQGEENEVDVLTREFWPWMKGKWDDINYAINWYKRNRGEWTRQLKNAKAARAAEDRKQAEPEGPSGQTWLGIRTGEGTNQKESRSGTAASSLTPPPSHCGAAVLGDLQLQSAPLDL